MKPATQKQNESTNLWTSMKLALAVGMVALAAARSIGDEVCARTDGSSTRDQATGSVLMVGATVVGASFSRDGSAFGTDPATCGTTSQSESRFPDCDEDGFVTLADYGCLHECFTGPDVAASEKCTPFDANANGSVDLEDLSTFQNRFGSSIGG